MATANAARKKAPLPCDRILSATISLHLTASRQKSIITKERVTGVSSRRSLLLRFIISKEEPPRPRSGSFFYLEAKQKNGDLDCKRKCCNEERELFIERHAHHLPHAEENRLSPVTIVIIARQFAYHNEEGAVLLTAPSSFSPRGDELSGCLLGIRCRDDGGNHEETGGACRLDGGQVGGLDTAADDHGHRTHLGEGGDLR